MIFKSCDLHAFEVEKCTKINGWVLENILILVVEVLYTTTLLTVSQLRICGSWDSSTRRENINFEFFGNWSAKYNENLLMHLSTTPKNAWYLSPQIQNEMIDRISNSIPSALISKLNKSKFVSIIADKSSDVSMTEQMAVCIPFVKKVCSKWNCSTWIVSWFCGFTCHCFSNNNWITSWEPQPVGDPSWLTTGNGVWWRF